MDALCPLDRTALYLDPGTGKTFTSLAIGYYKLLTGYVNTVLVIVPPVLLTNWARNIAKIPDVTYSVYAGTPAERKKINLDVQFIVVGIQIFKRDFDYITEKIALREVFGIVDEAQCLKNSSTDNFKKVREFFSGQQICLLTGTPMSTPPDAYGLIKITSPTIYKSFYQWSSIHVAEVDFFKRPTKYANLELLGENLMIGARRVLKEDVLKDLPEVTYTPMYYDMTPDHLRLYRRIADEQMVKLENGGKKDFTANASALWNAMSQIPCNAEYFSEGNTTSTVLDLVEQVMDGMGNEKLVVFTHYVMTTERVRDALSEYNPAVLYGKTKDRQAEIDKFVNDPSCRAIVANLAAGGAGLDQLQTVSRSMIFLELPRLAAPFRQAVARLHRDGQKNAVNVMVAIANKTLLVKAWEAVQGNDELIASIIRSPQTIRAALAGL